MTPCRHKLWNKKAVYLSQLLPEFLTKLLFVVLYYYTSIHLQLGSQSKVQVVATACTFRGFFLSTSQGRECLREQTVRRECQF